MDEEDLKYALRKIMNNYNMVDDENGEHDFDERRYSDFNAWIKCTCDRDPLKLVGRKVCFDKYLCPLEYYVIDAHHSYCSQSYPGVIDEKITVLERKSILEMHNHERRLVYGKNMQKMYWNDDLAEIAQRYARTCIFDHDRASQRSVPKIPLSTGQNLAMGYENWTQAIQGWISEKQDYFYDYPSSGIVSHYTQIIWHSTALVGCAATMCPPYGSYTIPWPFYVCNYITGQLNSNFYKPYEQGVDNQLLRDCHGKVCLYNGTLDLNTCECQCSTYASGSQCERLNCSILPPCPYYSSASCKAVNVPLECPELCGLCNRYEVLKSVYGENNLTPITVRTKSTKIPPRFR
ncbi:unnamed protein product [Rotaria socialis]|uniref:SCP domain-containing protein n=1 Tax=Rotaria socialis TaxID=392032 RepID=A0A820T207_9BILA|nr:unnamed protein product [Rotaria socialis]CAF4438040.1 unnamed protein product [Rotaria socialis]CAF4460008.1 unnamed protein product [Rotaria socialis]CAF4511481.1 unnamed protein product [Rotaria socialis]CAF4551254.1 unnamed protein product [Rotaria socialis]